MNIWSFNSIALVLGLLVGQSTPPAAQTDDVHGVESRVVDVKSRTGLGSGVAVPTLVMWGDQDLAMHRVDHERIATLVNTNRPGAATLYVVRNAGHDLAAGGVVSEDVLATMQSWIKGVISR